MLEIIALRHGLTEWNQSKRMQGHADIPLCPEGVRILERYTLPAEWYTYDWYSSPLMRAQQTAQHLNLKAEVSHSLREMHWGDWEGQTHAELRERYGAERFKQLEDQGLDLKPPNGESARQVQQRINAWVSTLAAQKPPQQSTSPIGIVAHKGIIRALLAAAYGWDMRGKPPLKLDYQAAHRFGWDSDEQSWQLLEANIRLLP